MLSSSLSTLPPCVKLILAFPMSPLALNVTPPLVTVIWTDSPIFDNLCKFEQILEMAFELYNCSLVLEFQVVQCPNPSISFQIQTIYLHSLIQIQDQEDLHYLQIG